MEPVQFPIKMLTWLAIFGLGPVQAAPQQDLLDHDTRRLGSEKTVSFKEAHGGKVVLVVNTASKSAFTGRYEGLEALYGKYCDRGLVAIGFPSIDFGGQEPGTEAQIKNFCRLTYSVKFPMFAKTHAEEGSAAPLFQVLGEAAGRYPKWNFRKYLIARDGRLVDNYLSWTSPQNSKIINAVEALL